MRSPGFGAFLGPGKLAESNAAQVRAVRQIIEGMGPIIATPDEAREIRSARAARRCDSDSGPAAYFADNSLTGRTSMLPMRAGGIFDANWIASFKSLASIR